MERIIIYSADGTQSVTMPRCKYMSGGEPEYKETKMASGKKVRDIVGFRRKLTAVWDYVPDADIKKLHSFLREGKYLRVQYTDLTGDVDAKFDISYPETDVFRFREGVPIWHNVSVTMTAQEVI